MSDFLRKYLFADRTVRAQTVDLTTAWQQILANHDYPEPIVRLLGDLVAASVLLSANLKFDGTLALQLQGDGGIPLIVVECRANLDVRATVKVAEGAILPPQGDLQSLMNPGGRGRFSVVLDPPKRGGTAQPYQGVVPMVGDTVSQVLEHYMATSEQLQTRLWLGANASRCAGLLLQRLPDIGGHVSGQTEPSWERALQLANTLDEAELLEISSDTLMHRLFWQEDLLAFEPQAVRFRCPCSREKVGNMLRLLGQTEVDDILDEQGQVTVNCDYCTRRYVFDRVDCAEVFASDQPNALQHRSGERH
ncbi:MAG: Hsp33 family molecular chaperone HslO [Pigmentiphaga sp.]|nr:Hsp33 family molecular chaperone HslO [Pigmentiphaga sp.]